MTPLVLLDVDGVLNAVTRQPDPGVWPDWQLGRAEAHGNSWPIQFSPTVTAHLRSWHTQDLAELQWLTTWGAYANAGLHLLLGLPELAVAGTHDGTGSASTLNAASLAGETAAAPDELTGRWWKLDVVRRLRAEQPERLIVWVDDELRGDDNPFARWATTAGIEAVGPEPSAGLTQQELSRIEQLLRGS